ncbi:uncharacterized protein LOC144942726 [Lampetra fluviatilis]
MGAYSDLPCLTVLAMYVVSSSILTSSGIASTHWKLYEPEGLVRPKDGGDQQYTLLDDDETDWEGPGGDPIMMMMMSGRTKTGRAREQQPCGACARQRRASTSHGEQQRRHDSDEGLLTCGTPVNLTQLDHLEGISRRHLLAFLPEPEVALLFTGSEDGGHVDEVALEMDLRQAVAQHGREKQSPCTMASLFRQIGNYWRLKGNAYHAIECFRKALALAGERPDVLLDLARLLFSHQFSADGIELARRALHLHPPDQSAWLQHLTLGEMLKAVGDVTGASVHFRQALDLNPGSSRAASELASLPGSWASASRAAGGCGGGGTGGAGSPVTAYTLVLIVGLVAGALLTLRQTVAAAGGGGAEVSGAAAAGGAAAVGAPGEAAGTSGGGAQALRKTLRQVDWQRSRIATPSRVIRFKKVNHS